MAAEIRHIRFFFSTQNSACHVDVLTIFFALPALKCCRHLYILCQEISSGLLKKYLIVVGFFLATAAASAI